MSDLLALPHLPGLSPATIWGLMPRVIGLLYLIAMGSLVPQMAFLGGRHGITPIEPRLRAHARDFPGVQRLLQQPSVLWLCSKTWFLTAVPLVGACAGALVIYGGELAFWALLVAWLCFLSLEMFGLIFPWESLLLEAGFFALFLPSPEPLPALHASALPLPLVSFMFRWLVIRVMWGFAKVKFIGTEQGDQLYLRGFLTSLPLPTRLGWHAQHAPAWFLRLSLAFMFFAEAIAPGLALFPGLPRLVGALSLVGLMVGIHLTGNWGYFNVGYALLCLCLFDLHASVLDLFDAPLSSLWATPSVAATNAAMLALFVLSLVYFLLNSWIHRVWVHWPMDDVLHARPWARSLVRFFRRLTPFRILAGYGVFPPNAPPPLRLTPVFEGSDDGEHWRGYDFKHMPTREDSPPPVIAPHHPRLDHAIHYAGLGMADHCLLSALVGDGSPYASYNRYGWLERMTQHLLRGTPEVLASLGSNPFVDAPPRFARVSMYALRTTSEAEHARTGAWWHRRRVGTLVNPTGLDDRILEERPPEPDLFHPDWVDWKRRAPSLQAIRRAHAEGAVIDEAIRAASDLNASDVEAFWNQFVPFANERRGDWEGLLERLKQLEARFDDAQRTRFERILARLCWIARERLEPHVYGDAEPRLKLPSSFTFELLLQEIVLDGRDALLAMMREPARAVERRERMTPETALYPLGLFRYDSVEYLVRTFRWAEFGALAHRHGTPGIAEYYEFLVAILPREEDWRPRSTKHASGEWTLHGFETHDWGLPREA